MEICHKAVAEGRKQIGDDSIWAWRLSDISRDPIQLIPGKVTYSATFTPVEEPGIRPFQVVSLVYNTKKLKDFKLAIIPDKKDRDFDQSPTGPPEDDDPMALLKRALG